MQRADALLGLCLDSGGDTTLTVTPACTTAIQKLAYSTEEPAAAAAAAATAAAAIGDS
jgi:hypothetical protein